MTMRSVCRDLAKTRCAPRLTRLLLRRRVRPRRTGSRSPYSKTLSSSRRSTTSASTRVSTIASRRTGSPQKSDVVWHQVGNPRRRRAQFRDDPRARGVRARLRLTVSRWASRPVTRSTAHPLTSCRCMSRRAPPIGFRLVACLRSRATVLRPYIVLAGGVGQIDSSVKVTQHEETKVFELLAWRKGGPGFAALGAGISYAINPATAVFAEVKATQLFGSTGTGASLQIGFARGL